jgi:ribosome assembly protein RRB1
MSKRAVTELQTTSVDDGQAYLKASGSGAKRENIGNNEMGEFEDAWEDEIESDEEVVDRDGDEGEDGTFFRILGTARFVSSEYSSRYGGR